MTRTTSRPTGKGESRFMPPPGRVLQGADVAVAERMGRLPEAWIAPPTTRELRELVRHRAKLIALRSHCKAEVHAVLAKCGIQVLMSDLFGVHGTALLGGSGCQRRMRPGSRPCAGF